MFDEKSPKLTIHGTDECPICGTHYKYRKYYLQRIDGFLPEVHIKTTHAKCYNTMKRLEKAKQDVLNEEFNLFCIRLSGCKYN